MRPQRALAYRRPMGTPARRLLAALVLFASCWTASAAAAPPAWQQGAAEGTIASRLPPPAGFHRAAVAPGSFAAWLRALPLRPGRPPVHLFDGRLKANQSAHVAVLAVDVGTRDLQQCADAVMRLRAEYLRDTGRADQICFHFTSGDAADFARWRQGWRPRIDGPRVRWQREAAPDDSRASFRSYLDTVFTYAGSASLARELVPVDPERIAIGDVLIQGGHPGHAVLVVDLAESEAGERAVLLVQSYMPAQEIHVLVGADGDASPWYRVRGERVDTPEWTFTWRDLRRFQDGGCS